MGKPGVSHMAKGGGERLASARDAATSTSAEASSARCSCLREIQQVGGGAKGAVGGQGGWGVGGVRIVVAGGSGLRDKVRWVVWWGGG